MEVSNHSPMSNDQSTGPSNDNNSNSAKSLTESEKYRDTLKELHLQKLSRSKQRGRIELVMGPMFAGKSTELLRRVNRLEISGKKVLSVKFAADKRYSNDSISTHDR